MALPRLNFPTSAAIGFAAVLLLAAQARAQTDQASAASPASTLPCNEPPTPDYSDDLQKRTNLLGDMAGLRPALDQWGAVLFVQETSEVLGNVTGGVRRGAAYDGVTQLCLTVSTEPRLHWKGGTFNISAFQIHGRNLSAEKLLNLQTASGIEASRATRLWELWYQQAFESIGADVKLGQQSIDQEFITSQYSNLFVNTMMGWPMIPSADLFAGGPAYPLSSLGVRLRAQPPGGPLTVLTGVFDDNPPGGPVNDDSQLRGAERSGTKFNLGTGALFIAEMQLALSLPMVGGKGDGTYKLGGWYDSGAFLDQRFDDRGRSLADPLSDGQPRERRHNFSLYGVADQMIWPAQQLAGFARIMGAPADRNLIDFSVDAGLNLKAPLPGRPNDTAGLGYGFAKVSRRASDLDRDTVFFSHSARPIRSSEHFVEVTYQYQVFGFWTIQPDFQYVFNPGGGVPNPNSPSKRIGDEAIFGLRTNIIF